MPTALLNFAKYGNSIQILMSSPDLAFKLQMVSKKKLPVSAAQLLFAAMHVKYAAGKSC